MLGTHRLSTAPHCRQIESLYQPACRRGILRATRSSLIELQSKSISTMSHSTWPTDGCRVSSIYRSMSQTMGGKRLLVVVQAAASRVIDMRA